jgi:CheY-like chemotaxis protein
MDDESRPGDFVQDVRAALSHLYDPAYLQNHSLAAALDGEGRLDGVTRAQRVRRLLLDCIEALAPQELPGPHSAAARANAAARAYALLTYHYVDGLSIPEICERLAISQRQAYREHLKGVEAVASLVRERLGSGSRQAAASRGPAGEEPWPGRPAIDRLSLAEAEVQRLRQALRVTAVELAEILDSAATLMTPRLNAAGVSVHCIRPEPCPPVMADRTQLRQVLLNLFSEGLARGATDELTIVVTAAGAHLQVEMSAPLAAASRPAAAAQLAAEEDVGLAVARSLLAAQGGRLIDVGVSEGRWQATVDLLGAGRRAAVLVVDDNADIVALFRRYLGGHALSVVGVTDGRDAVRIAAELHPCLAILDVMMPNLDGWEVLQALRASEACAGIPIVICSILHEPQLAAAMGASDYLTKPVAQADFLQMLQRWLGPLQPAG